MAEVYVEPPEELVDRWRAQFSEVGLVLDVVADGRYDTEQSGQYIALVLSKPAHEAFLDEINRRRDDRYEQRCRSNRTAALPPPEEIESVDFVPWRPLIQHPLTRIDKSLDNAVLMALKAWQGFELETSAQDAAA
jgi:hypothetical protein